MHFELTPKTLQKITDLENERVQKTLICQSMFKRNWTSIISSINDSCREFDDFVCVMDITPTDQIGVSGTLQYILTKHDDEAAKSNAEGILSLKVSLPQGAFDDLWNTFQKENEFIFGGEIDLYSGGTAYSSFSWDIGPEENRRKPLTHFWFKFGNTEQVLEPGDNDESPRKYAEQVLSASTYHERSQMGRIYRAAVKQAQQEAERRGLVGWSAEYFIDQTIKLIQDTQSHMHDCVSNSGEHGPNKDKLWEHKNVNPGQFNSLYWRGRNGLEGWSVDRGNLAGVAARLIRENWLQIDELEWAIVDALTFSETFEFGERVKGDPLSFSYMMFNGDLRKMMVISRRSLAISLSDMAHLISPDFGWVGPRSEPCFNIRSLVPRA